MDDSMVDSNGAVNPSVPVKMAAWPYPDLASEDVARDLRDRMDRMMAAFIANPTGTASYKTLAQGALLAIQAVDDVLAAEGVEE